MSIDRGFIDMVRRESDFCVAGVLEEITELVDSGERIDDELRGQLASALIERIAKSEDPRLSLTCMRILVSICEFTELQDLFLQEMHKSLTKLKRNNAYVFFLVKTMLDHAPKGEGGLGLVTVEKNVGLAEEILGEAGIHVPW